MEARTEAKPDRDAIRDAHAAAFGRLCHDENDDFCCDGCGVSLGKDCGDCDGDGYHWPGCPSSDETLAAPDRYRAGWCWRPGRAERVFVRWHDGAPGGPKYLDPDQVKWCDIDPALVVWGETPAEADEWLPLALVIGADDPQTFTVRRDDPERTILAVEVDAPTAVLVRAEARGPVTVLDDTDGEVACEGYLVGVPVEQVTGCNCGRHPTAVMS